MHERAQLLLADRELAAPQRHGTLQDSLVEEGIQAAVPCTGMWQLHCRGLIEQTMSVRQHIQLDAKQCPAVATRDHGRPAAGNGLLRYLRLMGMMVDRGGHLVCSSSRLAGASVTK